jgi:hypothetical protein
MTNRSAVSPFLIAALFLLVPIVVHAQSKSGELAKQLCQLLDERKMESFAAADAGNAGVFVAAMYYPGTELLVVSAKHFNPSAFTEKLTQKNYQDAYADLNAGAIAGSKLLVMDTFADGLVATPKGGSAPDSIDGAVAMTFDGNWKKAKQTEEEYMKAYETADVAYAHALEILIAKLKAPGGH